MALQPDSVRHLVTAGSDRLAAQHQPPPVAGFSDGAGAGLNLLVIAANGGFMPVNTHLLAQAQGQQLVANLVHHRFASNVSPLNGGTILGFLGDRISLLGTVYSVGDFTLGAGVFLLALFEMNRDRWPALGRVSQAGNNLPLAQAA